MPCYSFLSAFQSSMKTSLRSINLLLILFLVSSATMVKAEDCASAIQPMSFDHHVLFLEEDGTTVQKSIVDRAEAAAGDFNPITENELEAANTNLDNAIEKLKSYLGQIEPANAAGWKKYLRWEEMLKELNSEKPDFVKLNSILQQYRSGNKGLDRKPLADLRTALQKYLNLEFFAQTEKYDQMVGMQIKTLTDAIKQYEANPTPALSQTIGTTVGWLESGGQVPELIASIREKYNHPNLNVSVSEKFLSAGISRPVDEMTEIREVILKTNIFGKGHTVGEVDVDLIPSENHALLQLVMKGQTTSTNVGYNGPVTIHSKGKTQVSGKKDLILTKTGIEELKACATAKTSTTFTAICAKNKLIRKIANKRAYQQKGQAEQIASQKAAARVARRMDEQTIDLVAELNEKIFDKFERPLKARDAYPQLMKFSTSEDYLNAHMLQATNFQLAAPSASPIEIPETSDLAAQVHESMINNLGESLLGGFTLTDERLVELLEERGEEVPEELKITQDKDPWSITFDNTRPVEVDFNQDQVTVSIRAKKFTRGDTDVSKTVKVSAVYKIGKGDSGLELVREGEVELDYLLLSRLGAREIAFKTFILKKFTAIFEDKITGKGLKLQGEWEKVGKIPLDFIAVTDGWLNIGWKLPKLNIPVPETASILELPVASK